MPKTRTLRTINTIPPNNRVVTWRKRAANDELKYILFIYGRVVVNTWNFRYLLVNYKLRLVRCRLLKGRHFQKDIPRYQCEKTEETDCDKQRVPTRNERVKFVHRNSVQCEWPVGISRTLKIDRTVAMRCDLAIVRMIFERFSLSEHVTRAAS